MLKELAKLQTQNRNYAHHVKKQDSLLRERDETITDLRKQVEKKESLIQFLNKELQKEGKLNDKNTGNTRKK